MKSTSVMLALVLAGATLSALAEDKPKDTASPPSKKTKTTTPQKGRPVVLTGSYIKQNIRRNGVITDGPNPVYVLDRKSIEVSGGADLSQVLLRSGFRR